MRLNNSYDKVNAMAAMALAIYATICILVVSQNANALETPIVSVTEPTDIANEMTEPVIEHEPERETKPIFDFIPFEPEVPETTEPEVTEEVVRYFDVPLDEDLQDHIFALCEEHEIDPALVVAMIWKESNFRPHVKGDRGNSHGLMQIQPRWNQAYMEKLNCPNLLDPYQNVTVGVHILADLFKTGKPVEWVLMRYNGGGAYANNNWNAGIVSKYAQTVLANIEELERGRQ